MVLRFLAIVWGLISVLQFILVLRVERAAFSGVEVEMVLFRGVWTALCAALLAGLVRFSLTSEHRVVTGLGLGGIAVAMVSWALQRWGLTAAPHELVMTAEVLVLLAGWTCIVFSASDGLRDRQPAIWGTGLFVAGIWLSELVWLADAPSSWWRLVSWLNILGDIGLVAALWYCGTAERESA